MAGWAYYEAKTQENWATAICCPLLAPYSNGISPSPLDTPVAGIQEVAAAQRLVIASQVRRVRRYFMGIFVCHLWKMEYKSCHYRGEPLLPKE